MFKDILISLCFIQCFGSTVAMSDKGCPPNKRCTTPTTNEFHKRSMEFFNVYMNVVGTGNCVHSRMCTHVDVSMYILIIRSD